MKIDDMQPGKLYRVTRTNGPMEFAYVGATGRAIVHAPGEPDSQSSIAVAAEDCSPWEATASTAEPVRVLLFDEDAQRTGPFRTFYDPTTGERFRVTDLTLASLPTTPAPAPTAKPQERPRLHITDLREKVCGGSFAVTKLVVGDDGYVRECEVINCVTEKRSPWGEFTGVTPDPDEAFARCLLHGAPSLKRDELGQFNQAELQAARAKFFGVTQ